jgi:hypothetical protein
MKKLLMLLVVMGITSCTIRMETTEVFRPKPSVVKNYTLGVEQSITPGDLLVSVARVYKSTAVRALNSFDAPSPYNLRSGKSPIYKNNKYILTRRVKSASVEDDPNDNYVIVSEHTRDLSQGMGIVVNPKWEVTYGWIDPTGILAANSTTGHGFPQGVLFEAIPDSVVVEDYFRAEISFTGIQSNNLKAVYREYLNKVLRPDFTQELQWDLDESKTIVFKGIKIEIISTTNSELKYKIVDENGLKWLFLH